MRRPGPLMPPPLAPSMRRTHSNSARRIRLSELWMLCADRPREIGPRPGSRPTGRSRLPAGPCPVLATSSCSPPAHRAVPRAVLAPAYSWASIRARLSSSLKYSRLRLRARRKFRTSYRATPHAQPTKLRDAIELVELVPQDQARLLEQVVRVVQVSHQRMDVAEELALMPRELRPRTRPSARSAACRTTPASPGGISADRHRPFIHRRTLPVNLAPIDAPASPHSIPPNPSFCNPATRKSHRRRPPNSD